MEETNPIQNPSPEPSVSPAPEKSAEPKPKLTKWVKILIVVVTLALISLPAGIYFLGKNTAPKTQNTPQAVAKPTPTPDPTANWKTYSGSIFSLKYPANWFLSPGAQSVTLSDVQTPGDIPLKISPNEHQIIQVSFFQGEMPTNFLEQNGVTGQNPTIKPFYVNGYSGIRGQSGSTIGTIDNVYIKSPNGGYVIFQKLLGDKKTFEQILSTFKFTNSVSPDETVTVETLVKDFYTKYLAGTPPVRDVDQLKTDGYLSDNAVNLIKQSVGFDLVTCSQNPLNASDYIYSTPEINNNVATINVSGNYSGPPSSTVTINLSLVKSGISWMIDSFSCQK